MKRMLRLLLAVLLIGLITACTRSNKKPIPVSKGSQPVIAITNPELMTVLDSFSKLNLNYSKCIPTVGYIQIVEAKANNDIKLLIESYELSSPHLEKLLFDEELKLNHYRFFIYYNTDHYFGKNSGKTLSQILEKERIQHTGKHGCGSEFTWLVHFSGNSIDTISYRATSQFETSCMGCNEWGDVSRMFVKAKGSDSLKNNWK